MGGVGVKRGGKGKIGVISGGNGLVVVEMGDKWRKLVIDGGSGW